MSASNYFDTASLINTIENDVILEVGTQGPPGAPGTSLLGVTVVPDAPTITIDMSTSDGVYDVTLAGDRTINIVGGTALLNGKRFLVRITQDSVGSRIPIFGAMVNFGADIPRIDFTPTPNKTDYVGIVYRHSTTKYDVVAFARDY